MFCKLNTSKKIRILIEKAEEILAYKSKNAHDLNKCIKMHKNCVYAKNIHFEH